MMSGELSQLLGWIRRILSHGASQKILLESSLSHINYG